jgi:polyisoprenoid-binding protein YceI
MAIPRSLRVLLLVVVAAGVAVTAGTWGYIHLIKDDAPAPLSLDTAGTTATTAASTATTVAAVARSGVDGTYKVTSGSQAGYRVKEVLFGQSADAAGRTSDVSGSLTIAGTKVTAASFTADMTTVASNESRRDGQFKGRIMDVSTYPTSTFVLTDPIDFGTVPADGNQITTKATGKLTLHGVTKVVTFTLQAKRTGSTIAVAGSIPVTFADYGISNPSGGPAQTEDHGQIEFLLNLA